MTRRSIALLLLVLATGVGAADDPLQGLDSVSEERARIEATRQRETALYDALAAECYNRFAVNDCLSKVQTKRRAMLSELKRQETVLNDAERKQRGASQLRLTEQKAQEKREKDQEAALIDNDAERAARQEAQEDKRRDNAKIPLNSSTAPRNAASAPATPDSAANRAAFEVRLEDAKKRRAEVEKRLKEKATSPPLKPLPVPP